MTDTVTFGGHTQEIETKPITMVFKSPEMLDKVEYPDRLRLEPEHWIYHAERVESFHARTPGLVRRVFRVDDSMEITPDWCRSKNREVLSVAGMIDMMLKFAYKGIPIVLVEPESGLHPAHQVELGDVLIDLMNNPVQTKLEEVVDNILPEEE